MAELLHILIASEEADVREETRSGIEALLGSQAAFEEAKTLSRGVERTLSGKPHVAFLDLSSSPEEVLRVIPRIKSGAPNTLIIGIYNPLNLPPDLPQSELFLEGIRAGLYDFLRVPPESTELARLMDRLRSTIGTARVPPLSREGKVLSMMSNKGGVGKTTLAANLASILARHAPDQVVLIDCSFQLGNLREFLGVEPEYTLYDAHVARDRLDRDMLMGLLHHHAPGRLYFMDSPREVEHAVAITDESVTQILLALRSHFSYVVVDTLPLFNAITLAIGDMSDHIIVLMEALVPTIKGTRSLLNLLKEAGYPASRIRVLLNRYGRFSGNIDPRVCAQTIRRQIDYVLPYDKGLHVAANEGKPYALSKPRAEFSRGIQRLAEEIMGRQPAEKPSFFRKLFGPGNATQDSPGPATQES